ncbi:MAG: hypothetical protein M1833_002267 [Piccolia ochrophora]|nr:MAG: hypothetical protein M1833_002267 [Piccolia ochrophora]
MKHHKSVLEGHRRMLEVIQKHTASTTDHYDTISKMAERVTGLVTEFEQISRNFSMYPEFSVRTHIYQGAAHSRNQPVMIQKRKSDTISKGTNPQEPTGDPAPKKRRSKKKVTNGDNRPSFTVDVTPTPSSMPERSKAAKKRRIGSEQDESPPKKAKMEDEEDKEPPVTNGPATEPQIEFQDITAEVDERLRLKEEKRRLRDAPKEAKRKRKEAAIERKTRRLERKRLRIEEARTKDEGPTEADFEEPKLKKRKGDSKSGGDGVDEQVNEEHDANEVEPTKKRKPQWEECDQDTPKEAASVNGAAEVGYGVTDGGDGVEEGPTPKRVKTE